MTKNLKLRHLGKQSKIPSQPDGSILDLIRIQNRGGGGIVRFVCHEFTCLCPATGQPDFGKVILDYEPDKHLCESKSLKLYLSGFRNHQSFHEVCVSRIGQDFWDHVNPNWVRVVGLFRPRGGIAIQPLWQMGDTDFSTPVPIDTIGD